MTTELRPPVPLVSAGSSRPAGRPAPAGPSPGSAARRVTAGTLKYLSLVVGCVFALVPLVVIVMASLKTSEEFAATGAFTPPDRWTNLENYRTAFVQGEALAAFANTVFILGFSLAGTVLIGSMAAYAVDRFAFRFRRVVVALFLLATLVPAVTTQVATFQIVNGLGLFNTRWSAIALFAGTDIVSIYIFRQFLRGVPRELDEAAALDGTNRFTIYWRIILPLLKPAIATVVIVKGIAIYNEFYIPFLYMPDRDLGVISTALFRFKGPFGAQWEVISAGVVLFILPSLVCFLALQKYIYNGFVSGAAK